MSNNTTNHPTIVYNDGCGGCCGCLVFIIMFTVLIYGILFLRNEFSKEVAKEVLKEMNRSPEK